jgi:RNA polymerase sigma-70 factor, ECF subfamily
LLFKSQFKGLCYFAMNYVRDLETSREIVQDAFMSLWLKREEIDMTRDVKSYITTTIRNKCLNWLRDHKKFNSDLLSFTDIPSVPGYEQPDKMVEAEIRKRIDEAIRELPDRCREIFVLSRFENKKYQEIADHMVISVKTVETQMSKALQHMRVRLREYLPVLAALFIELFRKL